MKTLTCPTCRKEFRVANSREQTQTYCSRECSAVNAREARPRVPEKICEQCGNAFRPRQRSSAGRFCSRTCTYAANRDGKTGNCKGGRGLKKGPEGNVYATVYRPLHPNAQSSGYVLEHRYVMAEAIGRPLTPAETVHHIDGDTLNNELSNLQLRQGRHGKGVVYRCQDCGSHNVETVPLG
jgi:hypothetical protein